MGLASGSSSGILSNAKGGFAIFCQGSFTEPGSNPHLVHLPILSETGLYHWAWECPTHPVPAPGWQLSGQGPQSMQGKAACFIECWGSHWWECMCVLKGMDGGTSCFRWIFQLGLPLFDSGSFLSWLATELICFCFYSFLLKMTKQVIGPSKTAPDGWRIA